ncbi:MAG: hypothetical protein ACLFVO_01230 [Chloroflexaceae bacterium]
MSTLTHITIGMLLFPNLTQLDLSALLEQVKAARQAGQDEHRAIAERAAARLRQR